MYAQWGDEGPKYNYIESRKKIYVPEYYDLMVKTDSFKNYKKMVKQGKIVVVIDFDGPRFSNGDNDILEITLEMLQKKINDPSFPFGHGYVVAASLAGYTPLDYCK